MTDQKYTSTKAFRKSQEWIPKHQRSEKPCKKCGSGTLNYPSMHEDRFSQVNPKQVFMKSADFCVKRANGINPEELSFVQILNAGDIN